MTEEQKQKFREFFPEYTVKDSEICLSPYIDIFEAGIELATKELQEEINKTQHLADVRCDQAVENYQKWHITNREKIDLEIKVEELEKQIKKMKCCENCKHRYFIGDELMCRFLDCKDNERWELKE